jgi:hypothetical protein
VGDGCQSRKKYQKKINHKKNKAWTMTKGCHLAECPPRVSQLFEAVSSALSTQLLPDIPEFCSIKNLAARHMTTRMQHVMTRQ